MRKSQTHDLVIAHLQPWRMSRVTPQTCSSSFGELCRAHLSSQMRVSRRQTLRAETDSAHSAELPPPFLSVTAPFGGLERPGVCGYAEPRLMRVEQVRASQLKQTLPKGHGRAS